MSRFKSGIWPFLGLKLAILATFFRYRLQICRLQILGPIDFLFGLPINLIVNAGQKQFEVDILKNVAKIANLRPI